jgi:fructose-1-phosphate kinase PfkB-like protein
MIITLTGNLLAERTFVADDWKPGKTQRATSESFQVGGKGINVTKMLARIGESTTAWCFIGGFSGDECAAWLAEKQLPHRAFRTTAPTRTGLVIRESRNNHVGRETTFLGPDRAVDEEALRACAHALAHARATAGTREPTRVALCGSFPGWTSDTAAPLREELAHWAGLGALDVDTYGPPLQWALGQPISLIKINRDELAALFDTAQRQLPTDALLALARTRWPVKSWVITDGPNDVYFSTRTGEIDRVLPPHVEEVSATGSGDVVFACLLHALYSEQKSLAEAVAFALPFGAANAAHPGVAEFALNNLPGARSFPT